MAGTIGIENPTVELLLPAQTPLVKLARLVASGIAGAAGFESEESEDLRIAVDELCAALFELNTTDRLDVEFYVDDTTIEVRGSVDVVPGTQLQRDRLRIAEDILQVVTDQHELSIDGDRAWFTMRKRRKVEDGV
jgi:hypothetical protein